MAVGTGVVIVVGGTSGLCLSLAEAYVQRGRDVVISGRDLGRATEVARSLAGPGTARAVAFDLAAPETIAEALAGIGPVDRLAIGAIDRDENSIRDYDFVRATRLVTIKLVGYSEVVHALASRLTADASILLFGGLALRRPYVGSTTVTTVNGGVTGLVHTMAVELAPVRVNAIHPGVIGDSPHWVAKPPEALDRIRARTPLGRLVTTEEIVDASLFLLENGGVNGVNLDVDGGSMLC